MQKYINNFETLLANNPGASGTNFQIDPSGAGRLGALGAEEYYLLTVSLDGDSNPAYTATEVVKVTAIDTIGGNLTVVRGYEGTIAGNWSSGVTRITACVTRDTLTTLQAGPVSVDNINAASYSLTLADIGSVKGMTYDLGLIQIEVPSNSTQDLPTGYRVDFIQRATQAVTLVSEGADVIESTVGATPSTSSQYGIMTLIKLEISGADSTWGVYGDIV